MDRRAWRAAAHGVTKSWIQLSMHPHMKEFQVIVEYLEHRSGLKIEIQDLSHRHGDSKHKTWSSQGVKV